MGGSAARGRGHGDALDLVALQGGGHVDYLMSYLKS